MSIASALAVLSACNVETPSDNDPVPAFSAADADRIAIAAQPNAADATNVAGGHAPGGSHLTCAFPEIPSPAGTRWLDDRQVAKKGLPGDLSFEVFNDHPSARRVTVTALMFIPGGVTEFEVFDDVVGAQSETALSIPLKDLARSAGLPVGAMKRPGQVILRTRAATADGIEVAHHLDDPLYFHTNGSGRLFAYDLPTLRGEFGNGDLNRGHAASLVKIQEAMDRRIGRGVALPLGQAHFERLSPQ